ncbi:hypothetical protein SAMN05192546_1079 [Tindallia californiensis]|uniref:Homeodomain-like domain-containing protein n=1 Tax=Tindallia californiensis TaxID=159292 RepID=A0A1H3PPG9_9FIRM|nr:hypothetical protein SAMN05192546_1079 [Tindallia californiensis]
MIRLVQKQEIILKHFREGKSQRDINRETGISRKTMRVLFYLINSFNSL